MSETADTNVLEPGQSSSGPAPSGGSAGEEANVSTVNLQIVSPSSQVRSPLSFQLLPTTTVKELKDRIRNALEIAPSNEHQRLIYRGRLLGRDTETLMEIFGEEALKASDQQTFHLVLRPPADSAPNVSNSTPDQPSNPPPMGRIHAQPHITVTASLQASRGPTTDPPGSHTPLPPIQPSAPSLRRIERAPMLPYYQTQSLQNNPNQQRLLLQHMQRQHDELREQLNFLHQNERFRAMLADVPGPQLPPGFQPPMQHASNSPLPHPQNPATTGNQQFAAIPPFLANPGAHQQQVAQLLQQQQQSRGQVGSQNNGPNPTTTQTAQQHVAPPSRTQSPALPHGHLPEHITTITRHGVNSNGERWQITVNESTTVIPPGIPQQVAATPPGVGDMTSNLQHLLTTTERLAAMQIRINNLMHRPGGTPPPGFHAHAAPQRPSSTPPIGRVPRPATTSAGGFHGPSAFSSRTASSTPLPNDAPVVYLMSSPSGPQALLIHNSQTFRSPGHSYVVQQTAPGSSTGEVRNRRDRTHRHRHRNRDANTQATDGANAPPAAAAEPAQNMPQGAEPLRLVMWPHIWLVIRLLIFVYIFTSGGNSSWSRLLVIWGIALFLFVVNTGAFNNIFGTFWNPIRQHLENLLPLAGPNPRPDAQAPIQPHAGNTGPGTRDQPSPEAVARRLLEQQRQRDASWLMSQFRRIEHAVLLFMASIVPGTAERHIEARTIEENRLLEQQRQEAAAAAAALEPTPPATDSPEGAEASMVQPEAAGGNEYGGGDSGNGAEPAAVAT